MEELRDFLIAHAKRYPLLRLQTTGSGEMEKVRAYLERVSITHS